MDGIVIGEGVLLDAREASVASRVLAALIDLAILAAGFFVVATVLASVDAVGSEALTRVSAVAALVLVTLVVPTTVDTLTRGRSVGKLALGIRIVRDDGGPIVFRHAFVRALVGVVELWITAGMIAVICSLVHPKGKRVGDILAGTYAIRVRGATRGRPVLVMPPQLAWWARHADVARLPDGLALEVRQFLGRVHQLHPGSRVELGTAFTEQVQRYVRPLPPPGTHPEDFLAAVIATRRDREYVALTVAAGRAEADAAFVHRLPHDVPDPTQ